MDTKKGLILVTSIFFLSLISCSHKGTRQPAGVGSLLEGLETKALQDLMGQDSPLNKYRHPMKVQFHVDGDKKYLGEKARKALHEALVETLSGSAPEQGFAKIAAGNLKDSLVENFIKTMRVYKIINVGLQVDLTFAPEVNYPKDFNSEMSSNQLINHEEVGKLSGKWEALEKKTFTGTLFENSSYIPVSQNSADYVGGAMTLYVKILDTNPKLGLPRITKNGVKGFVRYRRFYRLNNPFQKEALCDKYTLLSKVASESSPQFYTLDLYKNFNLANIIPTDETIEIFPGRLASSNEGRVDLMPDTFERAGKSIQTGVFTIKQKPEVTGEVSFKLKKIVYDLKQGKYDPRKSEADLVSFNSPADNPETDTDEQTALFHAKRIYMSKCQKSMESFFSLEKVVPGGVL